MNEAKRYKVFIFGDEYSLVSDKPQEHIVQASTLVDSLMKEITEKSKINDQKKVAVLTALRIASKVLDLEQTSQVTVQEQERLADAIDRVLSSV